MPDRSQALPRRTTALRKLVRLAFAVLLVLFTLFAFVVVQHVRRRYIGVWLPAYLRWEFGARPTVKPTDIMFLVGDHFEPGRHDEIVREWVERYPQLFDSIRDSDNRPPQHSFFYPAEQYQPAQLVAISQLVVRGYGEIELHLHHANDTPASLIKQLDLAKQRFAEIGAMRSTPGGPLRFGFIHGNWSLDNAEILAGKNWCGVNNELDILRNEGAYADFTFPAFGSVAQPRTLQQIYYAHDDPAQPKSYDTGVPVAVGEHPDSRAFMIFEGPLVVNWKDWRRGLWPFVDYGQLEGDSPADMSRFHSWLKADVHVEGRPEWVFIKLHTHGASDFDRRVVLSEQMAQFYRQMVAYCADNGIRLHFVTAREAYNIVKAAEAGYTGNADHYRDFEIKPYLIAHTGP